jgi:hypothetical protein
VGVKPCRNGPFSNHPVDEVWDEVRDEVVKKAGFGTGPAMVKDIGKTASEVA